MGNLALNLAGGSALTLSAADLPERNWERLGSDGSGQLHF